jgi:hypothetical protein
MRDCHITSVPMALSFNATEASSSLQMRHECNCVLVLFEVPVALVDDWGLYGIFVAVIDELLQE